MKYCFPSPFHTAGPPLSPCRHTFTISNHFLLKTSHLTSVNLAIRETSTEHVVGDLRGSVAEKENNVISMIWAGLLRPTEFLVCTSSVVLWALRPPGESEVIVSTFFVPDWEHKVHLFGYVGLGLDAWRWSPGSKDAIVVKIEVSCAKQHTSILDILWQNDKISFGWPAVHLQVAPPLTVCPTRQPETEKPLNLWNFLVFSCSFLFKNYVLIEAYFLRTRQQLSSCWSEGWESFWLLSTQTKQRKWNLNVFLVFSFSNCFWLVLQKNSCR